MNLGVNKFLREKNPAAMEQMAHTMVQTIQKGLWKTSPDKLKELQKLESELHAEAEARMRSNADAKDEHAGTVMKKETLTDAPDTTNTIVTTSVVLAIAIAAGAAIVFVIRIRRKEEDE